MRAMLFVRSGRGSVSVTVEGGEFSTRGSCHADLAQPAGGKRLAVGRQQGTSRVRNLGKGAAWVLAGRRLRRWPSGD